MYSEMEHFRLYWVRQRVYKTVSRLDGRKVQAITFPRASALQAIYRHARRSTHSPLR